MNMKFKEWIQWYVIGMMLLAIPVMAATIEIA